MTQPHTSRSNIMLEKCVRVRTVQRSTNRCSNKHLAMRIDARSTAQNGASEYSVNVQLILCGFMCYVNDVRVMHELLQEKSDCK